MIEISYDFKFPDLAEKVARNRRRILIFIAASMQTNRGLLFDAEGAYNGHDKWKPLKFRQGQILSNKGVLRKSIAPTAAQGSPGPDGTVRISGDIVTIGTKVYYAALMNDGTAKMPDGVLRPQKALALKIPLPGGKSATKLAKQVRKGKKTPFLFLKSVKIPARPFNQLNEQDAQEFGEAMTNILRKIVMEE